MEMFHWENLAIGIGLVKVDTHVYKDAQLCLYLINKEKDVSLLQPLTVISHQLHHHLRMMKIIIMMEEIGLSGINF